MNTDDTPFNDQLALVVDDDAVARLVAAKTMSKLGFSVIEADDGDSALELLDKNHPDIILLDVEMERMNGIETCQQLRQSTDFSDTPIIMMTAHDDAESINRAFQAGATDFTMKPINWTLLRHKIMYVMRNQEVLMELSNAEQISRLGNWRQSANSDTVSMSNGLAILLDISNKNANQLMPYIHPEDRDMVARELDQLDGNKRMSIVHRMICTNDREIVVQHRAQSQINFNGEKKGVLGTIQDVTEKELISRRVYQLAYHDTVTKLFNRSAILEHLTTLAQNPTDPSLQFALLHVDIDNFNRINDSLGPMVGNSLLCAVADRMTNLLNDMGFSFPENFLPAEAIDDRSNLNLLSRLGADEFAVVLVDDWTRKNIEEVGATIAKGLSQCYQIDIRQITITASIGIAVYPEHGTSPEVLNQNAETAMHSVKRSGKNYYKVYDSILSDEAQRKMQLEEKLRIALDKNEFSLYYQPQIDISNLSIVGAEALLRWHSEELGTVSPLEFIPLAEEIGLIIPIGSWVLQTACEQLANWNKIGLRLQRMAVNVSVRQFNQDDFLDEVSRVIQKSGVNPNDLELEITESLLAVDAPSAIRKLENLKNLGVDISVDDFGTGYSSLSYLKKFPIDRLKIDRSFVRDIDHDANDIAITKSIIALARGLSLSVIAEGVETNDHLAKLTELGCDEAQGFLIGKPIPNDEFVDWYENYEKLVQSKLITKAA